MARNPKKITVENAGWVAEYLVSRVNRAGYKLKMHAAEKREQGNGNHPKAEVYRLAAQAVDLQRTPMFGQEQAWLTALNSLLAGLNAWVDTYLEPDDRTRLWTAYRVAKHKGQNYDDHLDQLLPENFESVQADLQKNLPLEVKG